MPIVARLLIHRRFGFAKGLKSPHSQSEVLAANVCRPAGSRTHTLAELVCAASVWESFGRTDAHRACEDTPFRGIRAAFHCTTCHGMKTSGEQTSRRAKAELGISSLFARLSCEVPRTFFTFFGGCFFNALEWNPFKNNFDNFPRMGKFPPPNVSWPSKPRI